MRDDGAVVSGRYVLGACLLAHCRTSERAGQLEGEGGGERWFVVALMLALAPLPAILSTGIGEVGAAQAGVQGVVRGAWCVVRG